MITFREFLLSEEDEDEEYPDLFKYVDEHCKPFLEHLGIKAEQVLDYPLFRGTSRDSMPEKFKLSVRYNDGGYNHETIYQCFVKSPRLDRQPLDTNINVSNMVDEKFKKMFGWEPRKQGMFVVGGQAGHDTADGYGRVCIFVPIGNFKYVWSPEIKDLSGKLTIAYKNANFPTTHIMKHLLKNDKLTDEKIKFFEQLINKLSKSYIDKNLIDAITDKPDHEIMVSCDKYLMILV